MNIRRAASVVAILAFTCLEAYPSAQTFCTQGSFGSYQTQGTCNIGILSLYNFELYTLDSSNHATAAGSSLLNTITVDPVWNSGVLTLTVGGFAGLSVGAGETAGWLMRFTADPPPVVAAEDVGFDPPFGSVIGTQQWCGDALFSSGGTCSSPEGDAGSFGFSRTTPGSVTFPSPVAVLDTLTTIRLNPNLDTASGFEGIVFNITTTEAATPEPATWLLLTAGLGFAGWSRRRQR